MRFAFLFIVLAGLTLSVTAHAGTLSFAEGQGTWKTTKCTPPPNPGTLPQDPETRANDLNARIKANNAYADAAKAYMDCISDEAQKDSEIAVGAIQRGANAEIQKMQADVTTLLTHPQKKPDSVAK